MKKLMVWMLLLSGFFFLDLCAQDFVIDGLNYRIISEEDKTVAVSKDYDTVTVSLTIPAYVTFNDIVYKVNTIDIFGFGRVYKLSNVSLPETLDTLKDRAFGGQLFNLEEIVIPSSVKFLGNGAFANCIHLKRIVLPENIQYIGNECFRMCFQLDSVIIKKGVTYGEKVYEFCDSIKTIIIEEGVTSIPDYMFNNSSQELVKYPTPVEEIVFPESVDTIGRNAFAKSKLKTLKLPSCKVMRKDAFYFCRWLKTITFGSRVEYVNQGAFGRCDSLKTIYCEGTVPPKEGLYKAGVTLHVPKGYKEIYAQTDNWARYGDNIVDDIELEGIHNSKFVIHNSDAPAYDLQGRRVAHPKQGEVYIQKGKKYINK